MKLFSSYLASLDNLGWDDKQLHLIEGLLAGNVFDWGAKEVAELMEKGDFGFEQAREKLQGK